MEKKDFRQFEELKINSEYLENLVTFESRKMCGKILKRFDMDLGKDELKQEVKELVYESWRDFRDLLLAHQYGLGLTQFNFKRPKNQEKKSPTE